MAAYESRLPFQNLCTTVLSHAGSTCTHTAHDATPCGGNCLLYIGRAIALTSRKGYVRALLDPSAIIASVLPITKGAYRALCEK